MDAIGTPMPAQTERWPNVDRRRLVRLCASLSRDPQAAEDLAQETLLEAWKNAHKLYDHAGAERWMAAIARNVCLRWARRRGLDAVAVAASAETEPADGFDVEVELERAELADLLDRALALLPAATRDVLVQRYIDGSPHAEIATRLGLSEDAVSMRLSRGKLVLRRLLTTQLANEAAAYGLRDDDEGWRRTRISCSKCGRRDLLMRRERAPAAVAFRCPGCLPDPKVPGSWFPLENPSFASLLGGVVRPSAILSRAAAWSSRYFAEGAGARGVACTRCGAEVKIRRFVRHDVGHAISGLVADCAACGEQISSSVGGLALTQPEVQAFRRGHPRTRLAPEREIASAGLPAILVRHEDVGGTSAVDVVLARDTLRVLHAG